MVGNRVFGQTLILFVALALLMAPWGSYPVPKQAVDSVPTAAASVEQWVNGLEGHVLLGQVKIAYWMIVAGVIFGAITSILNLIGWTQISSLLTFACFGMSAACSLVAIIDFSFKGNLGSGPVLAIACALAGIAISPGDEPHTRVTLRTIEQLPRPSRRAA